MGEKQKRLEGLLGKVGSVTSGSLGKPSKSDIASSPYAEDVEHTYRLLGGVLPSFPLNLRRWDFEFENIAIELDEQLHFNRYRRVTLESKIYRNLPAFPLDAYRAYCARYETQCIRAGSYGGKWSNKSCEKQFGVASPLKDLSGNGASRWKQRAFYDFVKDLSPLVIDVSLVRVAIWDSVEDGSVTRTVGDVLSAPSVTSAEALADIICQRNPRRVTD